MGALSDASFSGARPVRSFGPLSDAEALRCREAGIALAYDPAQAGWVPLAVEDDVDPPVVTEEMPVLRPWREDDVETFVALLDDPVLWQTLPEPYPAPVTPDIARDLIALSNGSAHHIVRAVDKGGVPVGQVRLEWHRAGPAEVSYWIGRRHWGRGLATAAVRLMLAAHAPAGPIVARVRDGNAASGAVLARLGFDRAGADPARAGWSRFIRQG